MSKIRLYGATSGYVDLAAPAVADDATLTLPTGAAGFGKVLQVVSTTKTSVFSTTSTSYTSVTGLSASITPSSASSKVWVVASFTLNGDGSAGDGIFARLTGGNAASFIGDTLGSREPAAAGAVIFTNLRDQSLPVTLVYLDSPATTSSVSYGVEVKNENATSTIRVGQSGRNIDDPAFATVPSSITVMEIGA